jgi:hypothetical protein
VILLIYFVLRLFNDRHHTRVPASRSGISSTVREDSSIQEEFVYDVIELVPRTAKLYAAADFPETTLLVLCYRLDRNIRPQAPGCEGDYYYPARRSALSSCLTKSSPMILAERKKTLYLLYNKPPDLEPPHFQHQRTYRVENLFCSKGSSPGYRLSE